MLFEMAAVSISDICWNKNLKFPVSCFPDSMFILGCESQTEFFLVCILLLLVMMNYSVGAKWMSLLMSANQKLVQLTFQELYCPEELFDMKQNWPKTVAFRELLIFEIWFWAKLSRRRDVFAWFCFWKHLQCKIDISCCRNQEFLIQLMECSCTEEK